MSKQIFIPLLGKNQKIIGFEEKNIIHIKGLFHQAVSILIFHPIQKMVMLQKRSYNKYHSSLLWTNTCCSHPIQNESILTAAHRCLIEEMGFDCYLENKFYFTYYKLFNNGLIENELDYVFIGYYSKSPMINTQEVDNWKWIDLNSLIQDINRYPNSYTIWFKIIMKYYLNKLNIKFYN
ncbi:isopentenyl-diphosphate Delta-isomerase [Blattabacterium cuenoti]|uniref:isopentenyl-diphosphate Delta-isomerase n=1 Tax=Blattabacterium cuenoti TaxID=1653831 RepID=UPI00163C8589|nr:NUDIX domain-containing protein [Blattabacterium cuenoti]